MDARGPRHRRGDGADRLTGRRCGSPTDRTSPGWKLGGFHVTTGAQVTCHDNALALISPLPAPIATTTSPAPPHLPVTGFPTSLVAGAGAAIAAIGVGLVVL